MGLRGPHGVGDVLLREIAKEPVLPKALERLALALRQGFAEVRKGLEPREDAAKRRSLFLGRPKREDDFVALSGRFGEDDRHDPVLSRQFATGVIGRFPFTKAWTFRTTRSAIMRRVSSVAVPMWGVRIVLGRAFNSAST